MRRQAGLWLCNSLGTALRSIARQYAQENEVRVDDNLMHRLDRGADSRCSQSLDSIPDLGQSGISVQGNYSSRHSVNVRDCLG